MEVKDEGPEPTKDEIKFTVTGDNLKLIKACLAFCKSIKSLDNPDDCEKARDLNSAVAAALLSLCIDICPYDEKLADSYKDRSFAHSESEHAFNTCIGLSLYKDKTALKHAFDAHARAAVMHEECGYNTGYADMHYDHAVALHTLLMPLLKKSPAAEEEIEGIDEGFDYTSDL